jgi:hypothetical protein
MTTVETSLLFLVEKKKRDAPAALLVWQGETDAPPVD